VTAADSIAQLEGFPGCLDSLVGGLGQAEALARPDPESWSLLEYLCHVRDYATMLDDLVRRGLEESIPEIVLKTNDELAAQHSYRSQAPASVMADLLEVRSRTVRDLRRLDAAGFERQLSHPRRGAVTIAWLLERWVAHEAEHLEDFRRLSLEVIAK